MFLEYLKRKEDEIKEKVQIKRKELEKASFAIKENRRFAELLDKEKATPFTEFTPQVVTSSEKKLQDDLGEQGKRLLDEKEYIEGELALLEDELSEISEVIKDAKNELRNERNIRKEDAKIMREKLSRIAKEGEYNPAKAMASLRKLIQELS